MGSGCAGRLDRVLRAAPSPQSRLAREDLALHREASAQVVGQPKAAPTELGTEDAVLLDQVVDDALLVAVDPPREEEQKEVEDESGVGKGRGRRLTPDGTCKRARRDHSWRRCAEVCEGSRNPGRKGSDEFEHTVGIGR